MGVDLEDWGRGPWVMSAKDPGYILHHDNLISENAIMSLSADARYMTILNYGNSDKTKNNIISFDWESVLTHANLGE